jgi:hypothetical protein
MVENNNLTGKIHFIILPDYKVWQYDSSKKCFKVPISCYAKPFIDSDKDIIGVGIKDTVFYGWTERKKNYVWECQGQAIKEFEIISPPFDMTRIWQNWITSEGIKLDALKTKPIRDDDLKTFDAKRAVDALENNTIVRESIEEIKGFIESQTNYANWFEKWLKSHRRADDVKISIHELMTSVAQYPWLLRNMQFINDFILYVPEDVMPKDSKISVSCKVKVDDMQIECFGMQCTFANQKDKLFFVSTILTSDDVTSSQFDPVELLKYQSQKDHRDFHSTTGVSVILRSQKVNELLMGSINGYNNATKTKLFDADESNLLRGYRIYVRDNMGTPVWKPLCRGDYSFSEMDGNYSFVLPGEDYISISMTRGCKECNEPKACKEAKECKGLRQEPDDNTVICTHGVLFRWDGWSLCASRPFDLQPQADEINPGQVSHPDEAKNNPIMNFARISFNPKELPSLRVGSTYSVIIVPVNLAGNSMDRDDAYSILKYPLKDPVTFTYLRKDPIRLPVVHNAKYYNKTESRLVVQSVSCDSPSGDKVTAHIIPPEISFELAEKLSMFDDDSNRLLDYDNVVDMLTSSRETFGKFKEIDGFEPDYIPDPYAMNIEFCLTEKEQDRVDGQKWTPCSFPSEDGWQSCVPIELTLIGSNEEKIETEKGKIRINLEPGSKKELYVRNRIEEQTRNLLKKELMNFEKTSQIELIHAVQHPSLSLISQTCKRSKKNDEYSTEVEFHLNIRSYGAQKIEIFGLWDEYNKTNPEESTSVRKLLHAEDIIPTQFKDGNYTLNFSYDFSDKKFRKIKIELIATSEFYEYFKKDVSIIAYGDLNVLNAEIPKAPEWREHAWVPHFRYVREKVNNNTLAQTRFISGVTLLVKEPWNLTGEGEKFAIILKSKSGNFNFTDSSYFLKDPVFTPDQVPEISDIIDIEPDEQTGMILISPQYDKDKDEIWIKIPFNQDKRNFKSPLFLKLATCRFQPNSESDLKLPEIAALEFIQIPPVRTVTVTKGKRNKYSIIITPDDLNDYYAEVTIEEQTVGVEVGWSTIEPPLVRNQDKSWEYEHKASDNSLKRIVIKEYYHERDSSLEDANKKLTYVDIVNIPFWD